MINWFPGHMASAKRDIAKVMPKVDVVIEVLDARIPFSSENPLVAQLRGDRPCIQILNKEDLADPAVTKLWLEQIEQRDGVLAMAHQVHQQQLANRLIKRVHSLVTPKPFKPVMALILGIPNVGKSTLINTLSGRTIAKTGNKPAVTQRQQRIKVNRELTLLDTPGFLWPKLSPPDCGYRLAVSGAISERVVDIEDIGWFAIRFLTDRYPGRLREHYKLDSLPDREDQVLEAIGTQRGYLRKGGVVDMTRTVQTVLRELRAGTLGRISFETPEDCGV